MRNGNAEKDIFIRIISLAAIEMAAMDEKQRQGIISLCKFQYQYYTGFINIGCTPDEAAIQTGILLKAVIPTSNI